MRKLFLVPLAIILIFSFVLGGCNNTTTTSTSTTSTSSTTTTATGPKSGGTLKIYYSGEPPYIGDPTIDHQSGVLMQLCAVECLAREDETGTLHPWLADSWQTDTTANTLTVNLKQGVKFQDGTDFDAEAVKWNWEFNKQKELIETQDVTSIDVVSKYVIRATIKQWDYSIIFKLLYSAGKIVSPAAWAANGDDAQNIPVGTGPFKFVSWTPDVGAKFVKWSGYRLASEGKPYLDAVEFKNIADATTAKTTFMAGDLDIMQNIDALTARELKASNQYTIVEDSNGINSFFLHIFFDLGTADAPTIFNDINIRKAVAYCIDTQALVDNIQYGFASVTNQWGSVKNWAHNPNVVGYPVNIAKAKECLAQTDYPQGFSTKLYYWTGQEPLMLAIQQMLAEANINVEIVAQEGLASYQYIIHGGWNGLLISPKRPDGCIPYRISVYLGTGAMEGVGLYHSPDLDQMFKDALAAKDDATRISKAWDLQKYLYDDLCVAVPLFVQATITAKYPYVKGDGFATAGDNYWTPESAWMDK